MQLLDCQNEAAQVFVSKDGRMYLSAHVGHGKTLVAAECHRLSMSKRPAPALYCTTKSALKEQAEKFRAHGLKVVVVDMSADKRLEMWKSPANVVYVATLDLISSMGKLEWLHFRRVAWGMIAIDEADRLTAGASKRNRRLLSLDPRHRLMMSGTELRNGLIDAYFPIMWLAQRPPWKNWTEFSTKELRYDNPNNEHQMTGFTNGEEHMAALVRPHMHRMVNPDAPKELVAKIIPVNLSPPEREAYKTMVKEMIFEAENGLLTISNRAVLNLRCRQFVALPEALGVGIASSKERALLELLPTLTGNTIIFTSFATVASILSNRHGWQKIIGAMSRTERQAVMLMKPKVIIATSAAERGLDMPWLTNVVSMDAGFTAATVRQRAGRATRYGRTGEAKLFLLQAPDTVDVTSEEKIINRKINEARKIWKNRCG